MLCHVALREGDSIVTDLTRLETAGVFVCHPIFTVAVPEHNACDSEWVCRSVCVHVCEGAVALLLFSVAFWVSLYRSRSNFIPTVEVHPVTVALLGVVSLLRI